MEYGAVVEYKRSFHPIYIPAILYVIGNYSIFYLFQAANEALGSYDYEVSSNATPQVWPLFVPLILGIVNLMIVLATRKRLDRIYFLNCAVLIKYCMIPLFVIGGLIIAIALLLMFTPVVIMVFVGPAVAGTLSVLGWFMLAGGAPYSLAYIILSNRERVHGRVLSTAGGILQFFFMADVISLMVLSLKEGRWRKLTIFVVAVLVITAAAALIAAAGAVISAVN